MYRYEDLKPRLFTEDGQEMFISIRDNTNRLLTQAGAVRLQEAIKGVCGDSWLMLACIDRMVERGEIREVTCSEVPAQHRVFVSTVV